jgi:hypothetical protein
MAATGRPPYGTGRPEAVLYRIVHDEPDLEGVPADLLPLVESAMARHPEHRPTSAELLTQLGGASQERIQAVHLPRDVDATTVLQTDAFRPRPTAVLTVPPRPAWDEPVHEEPVYEEAAYQEPAYERTAYDHRPYDDPPYDDPPYDDLPEPRPSGARSAQVVATGAAALAVVATAALVVPVVTGALVLVGIVLLRTVGRSSDRLALRRERRGGRRRDPFVAALTSPFHLLAALADLLVSLPLMAVAGGVPAGLLYLLDPTVNGLEGPELAAATGTVGALLIWLARRGNRRSRRALRGALLLCTPSSASAVAVVAVLAVSAVLLLATAEGSAPTWWPLTSAP